MKTQMHIIRLQKTEPRGIGKAQNQGEKKEKKHKEKSKPLSVLSNILNK